MINTSYYNPLYYSIANPYLVWATIDGMREKYTNEKELHSSCKTTLEMLKNPPKGLQSNNVFLSQKSDTRLEMFYNSAWKCVTWLIDKWMDNISEKAFSEDEPIALVFLWKYKELPDELLTPEDRDYFLKMQSKLEKYKIFPECQSIIWKTSIDKKLMKKCYKYYIIALYDYQQEI